MKIEMLERFIGPLKRKVLQSITRGVVQAINDSGGLQSLQVSLLADELHSEVDRVQNYGFTSNPLPGAEGVFLSVGGAREHGVVVVVDDRRFRLKPLASGEVAMYTDEGDKIHFKRGNIIEINSLTQVHVIAPTLTADCTTITANCTTATVNATSSVTLNTPSTTCTGDLQVDGNIHADGNISSDQNVSALMNVSASVDVSDQDGTMGTIRSVYNSHTHSDPQGGSTGGPTPTM